MKDLDEPNSTMPKSLGLLAPLVVKIGTKHQKTLIFGHFWILTPYQIIYFCCAFIDLFSILQGHKCAILETQIECQYICLY